MNIYNALIYKKLYGGGGGGEIEVESLTATENKTYNAGEGKAYNPVVVAIPEPTLISKNITANGNYSASTDNADGYSSVSVNVPLPDNAYLLQSIEHESIATFTDGTDNFVKALEVAIEPQQDLHGYDHPWVGGAGKNKLENATSLGSRTINGVTITTREDGSLLFNGTSTGAVNFIINSNVQLPDNTYILSTDTTMPTNSIIAVNTSDGNKTTQDSVTFTGSVNGNVWIYVGQEGVVFNNLIIKPMIRLATVSDATFAPYSNICPISGWDEVNVTVADDVDNPTTTKTITIQLGDTYYGGKLDVVNGVLTLTHGFISSYNGETLPSTWISDRDVYAEGTTPTIGAEVCYKLATPQTIQLSPTIIKSLQGENNFFASTGEIELLQYWGKEVTS